MLQHPAQQAPPCSRTAGPFACSETDRMAARRDTLPVHHDPRCPVEVGNAFIKLADLTHFEKDPLHRLVPGSPQPVGHMIVRQFSFATNEMACEIVECRPGELFTVSDAEHMVDRKQGNLNYVSATAEVTRVPDATSGTVRATSSIWLMLTQLRCGLGASQVHFGPSRDTRHRLRGPKAGHHHQGGPQAEIVRRDVPTEPGAPP